MDFIAEIRRRHFINDESISSIALSLNLSRTTVRKHLKTIEKPVYQRKNQSFPKLGEFQERFKQWLEAESKPPTKASWYSVDRNKAHQTVRRLQMRIANAA